MSLSTLIKSLQDIMRKDVGVDGDAQRIGQLVWILFLKIFDDREKEAAIMTANYRSPIPKDLRWSTWAADPEGLTGNELLDFCNNRLFPGLKELRLPPGKKRTSAHLVKDAFADAYQYMKSGTLLRQIINRVEADIDFNSKSNRHLFGDIYEQLLRDLQSAGNSGEYYTPRPVTRFMVEMTDPQLGESILDPACGTGGFLSCSINYLKGEYKKKPKKRVTTHEDLPVLEETIRGVEKKPLPHLLCTTNLLLHGIDVPNVSRGNTLERPYKDYGPKDRVDVIVSNPPFGGMEEDGIEQNFPQAFRTRETADLFLVLIMRLLKDGGRAAIVLPDGTLFGEGVKTRIKEKLLTECNLHTVVRLPNGVFNPYTGIKTNLLFFTKGTPTKDVWFYEHPYPEGYKSYSKTKPMTIGEFDPEKKWWKKRKESEFAWKVAASDIADNGFNLDIKNPNAAEASLGDPDELLKQFNIAQSECQDVLNELRDELSKALGGAE